MEASAAWSAQLTRRNPRMQRTTWTESFLPLCLLQRVGGSPTFQTAPTERSVQGRQISKQNYSTFFQGKGKGFLSTVAGIFKTSSTSPSPNASPSHQAKPSKEDSFLGRFSRKDGAKKRDEDVRELVTRTASLAMQASHPSTPPVPLSRLEEEKIYILIPTHFHFQEDQTGEPASTGQ